MPLDVAGAVESLKDQGILQATDHVLYDPGLLSFVGATLMPTAPVGASLVADASLSGAVGLTVAMPPGYSMPAGTGVVIKVSYRAAVISGKPNTTISFCDDTLSGVH